MCGVVVVKGKYFDIELILVRLEFFRIVKVNIYGYILKDLDVYR